MPSPARSRSGLGTLAVVGLVVLLVGGVLAFSATRTLGEFFGSSGDAGGGGHQRPPVPAAPASGSHATPGAPTSQRLSAIARRVRGLEKALEDALASGRGGRAQALRVELGGAQRELREALAGDVGR